MAIRFGIVTIVFLIVVFAIVPTESVFSFGKQTLKVGAKGGDVYELQGRLKYLGYYKGKIDGDFGWGTYKAVKNFQWKFGMKVDGVVGGKTKLMLWKATKNWRPGGSSSGSRSSYVSASGYSTNDLTLMARAVYGEARGESLTGEVAVAAVILNRLKNPLFPNSVSGVIFQSGAFTSVADGQIWLNPDAEAKKAVNYAISGWDPSGGALYYFNPQTATSAWIWSRPQIKQIGKHIFTK